MNAEAVLVGRAAKHAALADVSRLAVVDRLLLGDVSPGELCAELEMPSNLLAHHLKVLDDAGIATRRPSQGDRRRSYVTLVPGGLGLLGPPAPAERSVRSVRSALSALRGSDRVVFVCTGNSARSQLATALWRERSGRLAASGGTHPAAQVAPGARAAAERHGLQLDDAVPRHLDDVVRPDDVLVTVCDGAHEELGGRDVLHWSVPDPVAVGSAAAYDAALAELERRVTDLTHHLTLAS